MLSQWGLDVFFFERWNDSEFHSVDIGFCTEAPFLLDNLSEVKVHDQLCDELVMNVEVLIFSHESRSSQVGQRYDTKPAYWRAVDSRSCPAV